MKNRRAANGCGCLMLLTGIFMIVMSVVMMSENFESMMNGGGPAGRETPFAFAMTILIGIGLLYAGYKLMKD